MTRAHRRAAYEAILADSGVAAIFDEAMPSGGRPRKLSSHSVILGVLAALDDGRPAQLSAAHRALSEMSFKDQVALGFAVVDAEGEHHLATYRQFSDTFSVMCAVIDPTPVPSFKGVKEADRRPHLDAARAGVNAEVRRAALHQVTDALLEASVPEAYKSASGSLAIDWTDHETWSRPRAKDDPQPSNDPDASWGHAKRNAPGAKECLFYGYYAQVATMVRDEGGDLVPELVRRIAFEAPRLDPAAVMARSLVAMASDGVDLGDVLCDCGYSNRDPVNFASPLRRAGARLVMDLHANDRGPQGTYEGAIACNGQLYCPATPAALLGLGSLRRGATKDETASFDAACAELGRYKLSPVTSRDEDGYQRVCCPAVAGKLRCPLRPTSMTASAKRPSVLSPPGPNLEACCRQRTITVPPQVNAKTRQAHDYPSAAHRVSYARRTAAERTYASMADPSVGGLRRGWCRLFGLAKNTFMYALAVVVRNVRIAESFERRRAQEARRAAMGLMARTRRRPRRHESPLQDPPPDKVVASPG